MALNINGTTGISGVDGSASAPALQGTDSNTGINFGSDTVNINTGGTTRVTVDSAGSVGIGTSTPTSSFSNADDLVVGDGSGNRGITILAGTSGISGIEFSDGTGSDAAKTAGGIRYDHSGNYMRFNTNDGSERMRIHNDGVVEVKSEKLTLGTDNVNIGTSTGNIVVQYDGAAENAIKTRNIASGTHIHMVMVSISTATGSISGTSNSVSFNNLSDYRKKENAVSISDGITRIKTLKPYRFNFISEPSKTIDGFFAHEVTPAVPEAVTGEKDAVDSSGEIDPQMLDNSKLIPLLTAALQEAIAKIEVLETKVAALEAR